MFIKIFLIFFIILVNISTFADDKRLLMASTTSTYDSGLLDYINKKFENKYNIKVHVIALGTGQAIKLAKNGDVDMLLVHHMPSEIKFIKDGYGIERHKLMYNDYVLVGPKIDNEICVSINSALLRIKNNKYTFISRADESGTHKKEKELWIINEILIKDSYSWYKKIGQGMGGAIILANEMNGYTISDRGTWLSSNKKENLKIICENQPPLINQYSIISVNPKINSNINSRDANIYIKWIISNEGKKIINSFRKNNKQLFYFNHH